MPTEDDLEPDEEPLLEDDTAGTGRSNRVMRFARRLMDRRELAEDTKDLLYAVLATSDKAKSEAVRLVAREVRTYLKELRLMELAQTHSLEISLRLKPLPKDEIPEGVGEDPEEA